MVVTQPLKDGFWLKAIQLKRHGCRLLIHGMCHVVVVLHELTGTAVFKVIRAWGRGAARILTLNSQHAKKPLRKIVHTMEMVFNEQH